MKQLKDILAEALMPEYELSESLLDGLEDNLASGDEYFNLNLKTDLKYLLNAPDEKTFNEIYDKIRQYIISCNLKTPHTYGRYGSKLRIKTEARTPYIGIGIRTMDGRLHNKITICISNKSLVISCYDDKVRIGKIDKLEDRPLNNFEYIKTVEDPNYISDIKTLLKKYYK